MTEVQQHLLEQRTRLIAFNGAIAPPPSPLLYFSCESSRPVCWPESTVKHYILAVECL